MADQTTKCAESKNVKPNAKTLESWAESADHESLSAIAKYHRLNGQSYLIGCMFKSRGEVLVCAHDMDGVVMGGLENYLIWPMEDVAYLPHQPTWRQRLGLWVAGIAASSPIVRQLRSPLVNIGEKS